MPGVIWLYAALAALVLAVEPLVWLFRNRVDHAAFGEIVIKLLRADERKRLVKICRALRLPVTEVTLELLALELPRVEQSAAPTHYRDGGAAGEPFEVRLWQRAAAIKQPRILRANRRALVALPASLGAVALGLVAGLLLGGSGGWVRSGVMVAVFGGALFLVASLYCWRDLRHGLEATATSMMELLTPAEEMSEAARAAAAQARKAQG